MHMPVGMCHQAFAELFANDPTGSRSVLVRGFCIHLHHAFKRLNGRRKAKRNSPKDRVMLNGAIIMLAVNIAVGTLFGASYVIVAFANRGQRRAFWLGVSYLIGNVAPLGDLVASFLGHSLLLDWVSYVCFLAALSSMSLAFSYFHRQPMPVKAFVAVFASGILIRSLASLFPAHSLYYGFAYQVPFAMACTLSTVVVFRSIRHRPLYGLLAGVFSLTTVHFLLKPFLLVRFGSPSPALYTRTMYALLSQASTGILLFACGIVLLILVSQKAVMDSQQASETDPLSGVLNRRGFDREAAALLDQAGKTGTAVTAIIFDLDFFKRINDTYGHATGDRVIVEFADVLRKSMPGGSLMGRIGGEEFAILLTGHNEQSAMRYAEDARTLLPRRLRGELEVTVSGGIASAIPGEQASHVLRRADQALYAAKNDGRNRIARTPPNHPGGQPVAMRP